MTNFLFFNNNVNYFLINLIEILSIIISYIDSFILILTPNLFLNYILINKEINLFGAFILFAHIIGKEVLDDTNKNEPKSETSSKDSTKDRTKLSNKLSQSFSLFGVVLSQLNINVEDTASNLTQISYGIFLISLVALCCFINIMGFLITYILIQKSNYERKYPKIIKFINYYKKSSLFYVTIEALLCLTCLLLLVVFSLLIVYSGINN